MILRLVEEFGFPSVKRQGYIVITAFDAFTARFCGRVAPQLDAESRSDSATMRFDRVISFL